MMVPWRWHCHGQAALPWQCYGNAVAVPWKCKIICIVVFVGVVVDVDVDVDVLLGLLGCVWSCTNSYYNVDIQLLCYQGIL